MMMMKLFMVLKFWVLEKRELLFAKRV